MQSAVLNSEKKILSIQKRTCYAYQNESIFNRRNNIKKMINIDIINVLFLKA